MKEFKVGDKVWFGKSIYTIKRIYEAQTIAKIENDTTETDEFLSNLTHWEPIISPTVESHETHLKAAQEALSLDDHWKREYGIFPPILKGDDTYCHCGSSNTVVNSAYGNVFTYCRNCKKERQ